MLEQFCSLCPFFIVFLLEAIIFFCFLIISSVLTRFKMKAIILIKNKVTFMLFGNLKSMLAHCLSFLATILLSYRVNLP